jgi:hypothetical protein
VGHKRSTAGVQKGASERGHEGRGEETRSAKSTIRRFMRCEVSLTTFDVQRRWTRPRPAARMGMSISRELTPPATSGLYTNRIGL